MLEESENVYLDVPPERSKTFYTLLNDINSTVLE